MGIKRSLLGLLSNSFVLELAGLIGVIANVQQYAIPAYYVNCFPLEASSNLVALVILRRIDMAQIALTMIWYDIDVTVVVSLKRLLLNN